VSLGSPHHARLAQDYSVVAGSPPLNAFITASIPDVMNITGKLLIADC
jgi:hypothetical protein